MKKIFSGLLLCLLFLGQTQWLQLYAADRSELASEKREGVQTLAVMEQVIDTAVEKLDDKLEGSKQAEKLEEKHEEIEAYLEETQKEIQKENSSQDIKEKVEEAKKVVVLKVVSGVTPYEDIEENIPSEVASSEEEIEEAMETIQESLQTEDNSYSIIIQTKKNKQDALTLFHRFDDTTDIEFMYEADGMNFYEVFLEEDSIFRQEMLEDIESGILPESFIGMQIVLPEVYSIFSPSIPLNGEGSDSSESQGELEGENLDKTWGIQEYQSYNYFSELRQNNKANKTISVGVVDTGIDYNHPDLKNVTNTEIDQDFVNNDDDAWDDQGHGTHVAGTIAAQINKTGIIGVNPINTELIPLKICTNRGFCPSYAVLRALEYAKEKDIDVLNMSLGGRGNPKTHAICSGIQSYTEHGGIVIAASGNSNIDTSRFVPGGCSDAITVGAYDRNKKRAPFSNYGTKVDVSAPGVQVYSTYPQNKGTYRSLSGTSMATPHVVGLTTLIQSYRPDITTEETKRLLKQHAIATTTDREYKMIAGAVDVKGLMESFLTPQEEIVQETQEEEIVLQEELSEPGAFDNFDGEILFEANYLDSQKAIIREKEELIEEVYTELEDEIFEINLFENEEGVDINSADIENIEEEELIFDLEAKKEDAGSIASGDKIFNRVGELLDGTTEINSEDRGEQTYGVKVDENFDFTKIPQRDAIEINSSDENDIEEEQEGEHHELFMDGAEKGIEINEEETYVEVDLQEGITAVKTDFITLEDGTEIDISKAEVIDPIEETIDYSFDKEVFIDGAEKSIEINSFGEEELPDESIIEEYEDKDLVIEDFISEHILDESEDVAVNTDHDEFASDIGEQIENGTFQGESQVLPDVEEPLEEDADNIALQNVFYCTVKVGQSCSLNVGSSGYRIDKGDDSLTEDTRTRDYLVIKGLKAGTTTYELHKYNGWSHYYYAHTVHVSVEAVPPAEDIYVDIESGKTKYVSLGERLYYTYEDYGRVRGFHGDGLTVNAEDRTIVVRQQNIHVYNIHVRKVPEQISLEVYEGQNVLQQISNAYYKQYEILDDSIVSYSTGRSQIAISGKKPGNTEVYVKDSTGNTTYFILKIKVKALPEVQVYDIKVQEGQNTNIYLPESFNYRYSMKRYGSAHAAFYNYYQQKRVMLRGNTPGKVEYTIRDQYNLNRYILNVEITPKPPLVKEISIYEGRNHIFSERNHDISVSALGHIDVQKSSGWLNISAVKPGNIEVYLKDNNGIHRVTYKLEIIAKPIPKEYSLEFSGGIGTSEIHIPESTYNFNVHYEGDSLYDTIRQYETYFFMKVEGIGNSKILLLDKKSAFPIYIIHVKSEPTYADYTLHETDQIDAWYHSSYYYGVKDTSIVDYLERGRDSVLHGKKAGQTEIHISKNGVLRQVWRIEVKPKPTPIDIDCRIVVGEECKFQIPNNGYYVWAEKNNMLYIDAATRSIDVEGDASGNARVYVQSPTGDYVTHILHIYVSPEAVHTKDFAAMVGTQGELSGFSGRYGEYSFSVSQPGVLGASITKGDLNGTLMIARVRIWGVNPGSTELYIYRQGDHVGTIKVRIYEKKPITLEEWNHYIYEGDTVSTKILSGGGKYEFQEYTLPGNEVFTSDTQYATINLDSDKHEDGSYASTGEVKIKALKPGKLYAYFKDQFNQRKYLAITVKERDMRLSIDLPKLEVGKTGYLEVLDSYKGVAKVEISPKDIAVAYSAKLHDGTPVIAIRGKEHGVMTLTVTDHKGQKDQVDIIVGKGNTYSDEGSSSTGIRYIRDWGHESDIDGGMHWVEIEAFDRNGVNIAQGKQVTGIYPSFSHRPYSMITDGKRDNFSEGPWHKFNAVTVDLGALYDIERVNITHLFYDGRTYNKTKTEVSSDGVNWITLFDSTVDGTYAEPKDGSGREYVVPKANKPTDNDNTGIRYIRDWAHGSNVDEWSGWLEIEAIERGTGVNIARDKKVVSSHYGPNSTGNIVNGSIHDYFASSNGMDTPISVTIDLGEIYDIEKVKVWHSYHDSRTYNKTKTEVSSDGVNWITLFDSAVEGTYAEPKDGSGREYVVRRDNKGTVNGSQAVNMFLKKYFNKSNSSKFLNFEMKKYDELGLGGFVFEIEGEHKEVGFKYQNAIGEDIFETVKKQENGKYEIVIDKNANPDSYSAFDKIVPYFKDKEGKVVYYGTEQYLSFGILSWLGIESDDVEINNHNPLATYCTYGRNKYKRPANATCVTGVWSTAWQCDSGYVENRNSCIKQTEATQCKLYGTEKYFNKPINAKCVAQDYKNAWSCKSGYQELGNTCVKSHTEEISIQSKTKEQYKNYIRNELTHIENKFNAKSYTVGFAKGGYQSLEDYITETLELLTWSELIDLLKILKDIDLDELKEKGGQLVEEMGELYILARYLPEILDNIPNITDEKKGYYSGYVSVLVGLELLPALKPVRVIKTFKGKGDNLVVLKLDSAKDDWCSYNPGSIANFDGATYIANKGCKRIDRLEKLKGDDAKTGVKGPVITSKTIAKWEDGGRIDIENPNPGQRPGQIHYQNSKNGDSNKYYFSFKDQKFHIGKSDGPLPSNSFQKKLQNNEKIMDAVLKGKNILDGK